jgi:hypothetical protein
VSKTAEWIEEQMDATFTELGASEDALDRRLGAVMDNAGPNVLAMANMQVRS